MPHLIYAITAMTCSALGLILLFNLSLPNRKTQWACLLCLALTLTIYFAFPPAFKTFPDEPNLVGVSKNMSQHFRADIVDEGLWLKSRYTALSNDFDKRPFLFPFLLSLANGLAGYRVENVFFVNSTLFFGICLLLLLVGLRLGGVLGAVTSLAFFLSSPIVLITATSGSMDMLSIFLALAAFYELWNFLHVANRSPRLLLVLLFLFAHGRYENIFLTIGILGFLFIRSEKFRTAIITEKGTIALGILSTPPLAWLLATKHSAILATGNYPTFTLHNLTDQLLEIITLRGDGVFPFPASRELYVLALFLVTMTVFRLVFEKTTALSKQTLDFVVLLFGFIAVQLTLFLSAHFTDILNPTMSRYLIPLCLLFSLFPAAYVALFRGKTEAWLLLLAALFSFSRNYSAAISQGAVQTTHAIQEFNFVRKLAERESREGYVIASQLPTMYTPFEINAIHCSQLQNPSIAPLLEGRKVYLIAEVTPHSKPTCLDAILSHKWVEFAHLPLETKESAINILIRK